MGSRVAENKHSIEIGARLGFHMIAHTDAQRRRRRRRRFSVGGVHGVKNPPALMTSSMGGDRSMDSSLRNCVVAGAQGPPHFARHVQHAPCQPSCLGL